MERFELHTGTAVVLRRSNVDTDQIIPSDYLKRVTRTGFADGLFAAWRGPDFPLDRPEAAGASVLVAGPDFGTGSSREHAVWALLEHGFRVVVSSRFADIFHSNALKAGLLPVTLPEVTVERLMGVVEEQPRIAVTVDLQRRVIEVAGAVTPFDLDDYSRSRLLDGLDDVALTMQWAEHVAGYEARRARWLPRTDEPSSATLPG